MVVDSVTVCATGRQYQPSFSQTGRKQAVFEGLSISHRNVLPPIHESIGDVRQTQLYPSYDGTLSLCTIYFELLLH